MTFLVRGNPVTPGAPGTPAIGISSVTSSGAVLTASGSAPAGWAYWEFSVGPSSGGPWTVLIGWQPSPVILYPGLIPSTTYYVRVRGRDNIGQDSSYSSVDSFTTSAASGAKRWNPGHGVRADEMIWKSKQSERFAVYAQTVGVSSIKSVLVNVPIGMVMGATRGTYTWDLLDEEVDWAIANGKKIGFEFWFRKYGGGMPSTPQATGTNRQVWLPDWMFSSGYVGLNTDDVGGYMARLDIADCTDAVLDLFDEVADRYGSESVLEMVQTNETSASFVSGIGFSQSNYVAQWERFPARLSAAFPTCNVAVMNNFLGSPAQTRTYVASQLANACGIAVPDIMAGAYGQGNGGGSTYDNWNSLVYRGAGTVAGENFGTTDSRGSVPMSASQEVIWRTEFTPGNAFAMARDSYRATHIFWTAHGGSGGGMAYTRSGAEVPAMRWVQGVLPFISANPLGTPNTNTPSTY